MTRGEIYNDVMVCAGASGTGPCQGDSGGPAAISLGGVPHLAGITSASGVRCATLGTPGIYTRAASFVDWISGYVDLGWQQHQVNSATSNPTLRLPNIQANDSYLVRVKAHTSDGDEGEIFFGQLSATIGPSTAPRSVVASPSARSATITWTRPWLSGGNSSYSYRATASPEGRNCTASGTSCTITGLNPLTTYTVSVTATNIAGTSPAGTAEFTTTVRPIAEIGVDCSQTQQHPFTDIPTSSYAYGPAGCIYQLGVTTGPRQHLRP